MTPCQVAGGQYYASVPQGQDLPVFIYFHGYSGSGEAQMKGSVVGPWTDMGYLTVFPDGIDNTWAHVGSPSQARDELAYMDAVRADVLARFPVDPERLYVSGFSQGAAMVWDLACYRSDEYRAFAPASGTFWEPLPASCGGPVDLRHVHGTADTTVPMEGRPIGPYQQGDVFEAFDVLTTTNGCSDSTTEFEAEGLACTSWEDCSAETTLCTHGGKHTRPGGWNTSTRTWFESL